MAYDLLTSSGINSLISAYTAKEIQNKIDPLTAKKETYQNKTSAYGIISSKITALKSVLADLKSSGSDSVFASKSAATSNSTFVQASAATSAAASVYEIRTSQLAKSDSVISKDMTASAVNAITGTHSIVIKTGDGEGGEILSKVDVTFGTSETNQTVMEKIRNAINLDKGVVTSNQFTAADSYTGGAGVIKLNINGTETQVSFTGGGTYDQLVDELVSNINDDVSGVTAEKVTNGGQVQLKLTVNNNSNYISISDVSGFALSNHLNIVTTKEKSAAGVVNASVFNPMSGSAQFSLATKETGVDYRLKEISDSGSGTALSFMGLNLGTSRPTFAQIDGEDTPGYVYSDITTTGNQLNSKFTFNGISLQRSSNTITDIAGGMTFSLKSIMKESDTTVSVTVAPDAAAMKTKLSSFIEKFNDLYSYLKTNSSYSNSTRGALTGDSQATSILSSLSSVAYGQVSGLNAEALRTLSQIGITFNSSSGLTISDSEALDEAISSKSTQIDELFSSTNGVASKLYNILDPYLGAGGYIDNSISNLDSTITRLTDSITSAQSRIDKGAELLRNSYQKLQIQLLTLLSNAGDYSAGSSFFS